MDFRKISFSSWASLVFTGLGWLALILAVASIFYGWLVGIFLFAGLVGLGFLFWKKKVFSGIDRNHIILAGIVLASTLLFAFYSSPTIFSGRDQGTLSESAIRLVQNHQVAFSTPASEAFFNIYGSGKALNFPGFYYGDSGELITKFPLGYIAWLAVFYSFFGLKGLVVANAVSLIIFLFSFYGVGKLLFKRINPLALVCLVVTSFFLAWFFKFTLSENLGLTLVWLGVYHWLNFLKKQSKDSLVLFLLIFGLLAFVRIEALAFLAIAIGLVILKLKREFWKNYGWLVGAILTVTAILFLASVAFVSEFYKVIGKSLLEFFRGASGEGNGPGILEESFHAIRIFLAYALGSFLALGLGGIIFLAYKRKWELLKVFFLLSPSFLYLIDPNISDDHPWMLRRFIFAVIPVLILYTVLFLDRLFKKRIYSYLIIVMLIVTNLVIFLPYVSFIPHRNLLSQTEKIAANFQNNDLILVDRLASGDPFSMLSGPLNFVFGKQAVYFFNPADLEKIEKDKFSRILLIIPDSNLDFYIQAGLMDRLIPLKDYTLYNEVVSPVVSSRGKLSSQEVSLSAEEKLIVYGKIYELKK